VFAIRTGQEMTVQHGLVPVPIHARHHRPTVAPDQKTITALSVGTMPFGIAMADVFVIQIGTEVLLVICIREVVILNVYSATHQKT